VGDIGQRFAARLLLFADRHAGLGRVLDHIDVAPLDRIGAASGRNVSPRFHDQAQHIHPGHVQPPFTGPCSC
jgi:hypothetical protein